jgi:hypothetical protein
MTTQYSLVNAVTAWGAVGDGTTDNYATLQPFASALPNNVHVYFPAGYYKFSRPLEFGANDLWISGDGRATHLSLYENEYYFPVLNVGVRTVEGVSPQSVTSADRPNLYGILDANYAPAPAGRYGFRTNGNAVCKAYAGPGTIGALTAESIPRGGRLFDYWSEATGLTVRVCLFLTPTSATQMRNNPAGNGTVILGLGDVVNPGPWCLGTINDDPMNLFFSFRTNEQTLDLGSPYRALRIPFPTTGGRAVTGGVIHDIEVYVNFVDGTYGAKIDNAAATVTPNGAMTDLAGKHLQKNRGYPFAVGPTQNATVFNFSWGAVPDFGIYAFNVLRSKTLDVSGTDARYKAVADTVLSMDTDCSSALSTDRNIMLKSGSCVPFGGSAMRLFHTGKPVPPATDRNPDLGFVTNAVVSDLKITGSLGLGTFNHMKVSRVDVGNGIQGLEHLNLGTAYTLDVSDSLLGGYDTAVDLCQVIATFRGTNIQGMGDVAARFKACTVTITGMFVAGFSNGGRAVFDMIDGPTNGIYHFTGIQLDEEGYVFTDPDGNGGAVFKIDLHRVSYSTEIEVHGLQQDTSGSNAAVFLLLNTAGSTKIGKLVADGLQLGPNNGNLLKIVGPGWKTSIDRRGLTVTGVVGTTSDLAGVQYVGEGGSGGSSYPRIDF